MKRRERKWTKGKLLSEPQKHPILALFYMPEAQKIIKKRGEKGLHFNDMRYLLCKDYNQIKKPPSEWNTLASNLRNKLREYNDYTILQKDLTKLCEIGFLKKESRGYYIHVEIPVMRYIQDINFSGRDFIGSSDECDIIATESFDVSEDVEFECGMLFGKIMTHRASSFEDRILDLWDKVDSSKLDIQQKILLRGELYPFTSDDHLKKVIRRKCLVTTNKGKESYDIPPFRKRNAEKLRIFIDKAKKHSNVLGDYTVKYAIGMYTYPQIFTEDYIKKKGHDFLDDMVLHQERLEDLILEFNKPCYVLLAPRK
jgi:hypothetical protein